MRSISNPRIQVAGLEMEASTTPGVLSWSWTLVPAAKGKK
jgi:hypothetical protein